MLSALSLALFSGAALASDRLFPEELYQQAFSNWTKKHSKAYEVNKFFTRYSIFKDNMDFVTLHNIGSYSYDVSLNEFADMTNEEFRAQYMGYKPRTDFAQRLWKAPNQTLPAAVDWTTKGAVTPVKNQGQCGSCWAFSTTGSLESSNFLVHGKLQTFSEQQLVDCSGKFGNQGCQGGLMDNAFKYIEANGGLCTEADYPYTGANGQCKSSCNKALKLKTYNDVPPKNLDALASAVSNQPVSIAVDAGGLGWQLYHGGVYSGGFMPCGTQLDHGVLLVGYGSDPTGDYWKVKNSWGAAWGEQGYIRLKKSTGNGAGTCGLALQPSFPTVA